MTRNILNSEYFRRDTRKVAQDLIGKRLVVLDGDKRYSGIILETEAYRGVDDPASHASGNKTGRNRHMFETAGHAYVYFVYGMHYCLNVTTEEPPHPGAVLIRAVVLEETRYDKNPQKNGTDPEKKDIRVSYGTVVDGPGKVCQTFGITKELFDGVPLIPESNIWFEDTGIIPTNIQISERIGISKGNYHPWRWRWNITS